MTRRVLAATLFGVWLGGWLPGGVGTEPAQAREAKPRHAMSAKPTGKPRKLAARTRRTHSTVPHPRPHLAVSREQDQAAVPRRQAHAARAPVVKPLIVVDAGHGGHDPGAVGRLGTLEKTVTLAAARELRRQLLATGRYRVRMTRDSDKFVPLSRRLAMAQTGDVALFISIHADAAMHREARGASVYIRDGRPRVRDAVARSGQSSGSLALQATLIDALDDDIRMTAAPARQARLHVLADRRVPSVLLEMGYVTNKADETLLKSNRYRAKVAGAIREAIDDYLDGPPPIRG